MATMGTNEKIARWAGWFPPSLEPMGCPRWREPDGSTQHKDAPNYTDNRHFALWHGKDGLLAEIEERGLEEGFFKTWLVQNGRLDSWLDGYVGDVAWAFRCATSSQLAAALVAVIDDA